MWGIYAALGWALCGGALAGPENYFGIEVVDEATGRGIPQVELETVSHVPFWTDSGGRVAVAEPELMGRRVFFTVRAPGYEVPKEGFGFAGKALEVKAGTLGKISLKRTNLAERLYRLTGTGIYRDSLLLGFDTPILDPVINGAVAGQDSMQAVEYRGRYFWFGGDTLRLGHPLGQYRTCGATSQLTIAGGLKPEEGVNLGYFMDAEGFARPMWPKPKEGAVWTDGVTVISDDAGREEMWAHYSTVRNVETLLEHGVGRWDDGQNAFVPRAVFPPEAAAWRCPSGQTTVGREQDGGYMLFPAPRAKVHVFPVVRVRATAADLGEPGSYELFSYLDAASGKPLRDAEGRLQYRWVKEGKPITQPQERALIAQGLLSEAEALYQVRDVESRKPVQLHAGSVHWNEYRRKWVMIATQEGGESSYLGEVWYAEAANAVGPWCWARKILTQEKQSFYNPVHHPFFDEEGGRVIYFEGTYTRDFSGNPVATPRYEYNQIMYRLDLAKVAGGRFHEGREDVAP